MRFDSLPTVRPLSHHQLMDDRFFRFAGFTRQVNLAILPRRKLMSAHASIAGRRGPRLRVSATSVL